MVIDIICRLQSPRKRTCVSLNNLSALKTTSLLSHAVLRDSELLFPDYRSLEHSVAQLVESLCYKPEGREFVSRWRHWNFLLT